MARAQIRHIGLAFLTLFVLAGCQGGTGPLAGLGKSSEAQDETLVDATASPATTTRMVDRDVEAPQVFQATDDALWDGRPSLGGVWVASPAATDPERVIIRNPDNGTFVIGALFRRERDNPGPELQISSDAAAALGLLAGQPGKISVTALRRDEDPAAPDAGNPILDAAETVETAALDPIAGAEAAIDRAEGKPAAEVGDAAVVATGKRVPKMDAGALAPDVKTTADAKASAPAASPAKAAAATPAAASEGSRIQIGIFSVEANAQRTVDALAKAGITATLKKGEAQGKAFWMVTTRGDKATLAKVRSAGFADAFVLKG